MTNPSADLNAMSPEERREVCYKAIQNADGDADYREEDAFWLALKAADERAGELRGLREIIPSVMAVSGVAGRVIDRRISELEGEATNG